MTDGICVCAGGSECGLVLPPVGAICFFLSLNIVCFELNRKIVRRVSFGLVLIGMLKGVKNTDFASLF